MHNVITIEDRKYPRLLKKIGGAPKQLYYKGDWKPELFENCLAVVGARRMTSYGKTITEKLVGELASAGLTIVSGFMYGVDVTAHKAALRVGGKTIAVMPCGIDLVHPAYQKDVYDEILEQGGLVISEYEEGFLPTNWAYPQRNRIVAGLSKATLVVEAGERSGSLITANLARKYKRRLFSVPGPINSSNSQGTLNLIKQKEAEPVIKSGDILLHYKILLSDKPVLNKLSLSETGLEQKIIQELRREPMDMDLLVRSLGVSAPVLGSKISLMQLKGFISEGGGKFYVN